MDKLLPCPFCGGKAEYQGFQITEGVDKYCAAASCVECGATTPMDLQSKVAASYWNTRASEAQHKQAIRELVAALEEVVSLSNSDSSAWEVGSDKQIGWDEASAEYRSIAKTVLAKYKQLVEV